MDIMIVTWYLIDTLSQIIKLGQTKTVSEAVTTYSIETYFFEYTSVGVTRGGANAPPPLWRIYKIKMRQTLKYLSTLDIYLSNVPNGLGKGIQTIYSYIYSMSLSYWSGDIGLS